MKLSSKINLFLIVFLLPFFSIAQKNNSLKLNGVDNWIGMINLPVLSNRTISLWVKPDKWSTDNYKLNTIYGFNGLGCQLDAVALQLNIDSTFGLNYADIHKRVSTDSKFYINNWYHIAVVTNVDSSFTEIYRNGFLIGKSTWNIKTPTCFIIGQEQDATPTSFFSGSITDFRIYDKALTQQEIQTQLFNKNFINSPNLITYYSLLKKDNDTLFDEKKLRDAKIKGTPEWELSTAPFGLYTKPITSNKKDTIGENGKSISVKINNQVDSKNHLIAYNYIDSVDNDSFPYTFVDRCSYIWGLRNYGNVNADFTIDYSQIQEITSPERIDILYRKDINDSIWHELTEYERDDINKTITIKDTSFFGEYSIGIRQPNSYIYTWLPLNNSQKLDSANINLIWKSDLNYFKILVDTINPPQNVTVDNWCKPNIRINNLKSGKTYYWQVVGKNQSEQLESSIDSFSTINQTDYYAIYTANIDFIQIHYNDEDHDYFIEKFTVVPNNVPVYGTCGNTGLAYDPINHYLYYSQYNFDKTSNILVRDRNNKLIDTIDITPHIDHLQGLSYWPEKEEFFAWGTCKGCLSSSGNFRILHFDKTGNKIDLYTPTVQASPGMLDPPINGERIWMKDNKSGIAVLASLDDWTVIETVDLKLAGEGVTFDRKDSVFWVHRGAGLDLLNYDANVINTFPQITQNREAEGIVIDPSDSTIWVNADEYLHGGIDGGNRVWHVDPLNTYNKNVYFPTMLRWRYGKFDDNLIIQRDTLFLKQGKWTGTWHSPIIDFKTYTPDKAIIRQKDTDKSHLIIKYRGSDIMPTTTANTQFTLDFYNANNANLGWGDTEPENWIDTMPDNQYVQFKIEVSKDNYPPIALSDTLVFKEDSSFFVSADKGLIKNDYDFDKFPNKAEAKIVSDFNYISFTLNPDGSYQVQPEENFSGNDTCSYVLFDGRDYSDTVNFFVEIIPVNDQPFISGQSDIEILEETAFKFSIDYLNVQDIDNNFPDDFSYQLFENENYTLKNDSIIPDSNFYGVLSVPILINDNMSENNLSDTFYFQIDVKNVNDKPIILEQKELTTNEDNPFTLSYTDLIIDDIDNLYPDDFSIIIYDGENYHVNEYQIIPQKDFFGTVYIPIQMNDNAKENNLSDTFFIQLKIEAVNDSPLIVGQKELIIQEGQELTLLLDCLIVEDVDNIFPDDFDLYIESGGDYLIDKNKIKPNDYFYGTIEAPVIVIDNSLQNQYSQTFNVKINVLPINNPPEINLPEEIDILTDSFVLININDSISDIDNAIADLNLSWSNSDYFDFTIINGLLKIEPKNNNRTGTEQIWIYVSDGELSDSTAINFNSYSETAIASPTNENSLFLSRPNPFSEHTTINFMIEKSQTINLSIYDIQGIKVYTLYEGFINSGKHTIGWNVTNKNNTRIKDGIYICVLKTEQEEYKIKLMKIKK